MNWDKWDISLKDNITDNITTTFYQRKITISYLNYKLNVCNSIVILPDFYIHSRNANGYYNNAASKYVVHTDKEYVKFVKKLNHILEEKEYKNIAININEVGSLPPLEYLETVKEHIFLKW